MRPDEELKQLMAAARAGANDLASPEFARLRTALNTDTELAARFQRSQALDVAIASAFKNIEVPDGLADRILTQLRTGKVVDGAVPVVADDVPHLSRSVAAEEKSRDLSSRGLPSHSLSRRGWLALAGLGATAAAVAVVSRSLQPPPAPKTVTRSELASRVDQWLSKDWQATSWNDDVSAAKVGKTPVRIDNALSVKPRRWQAMSDAQGQVIVFDLAAADKAAAMLFMVPTNATYQVAAYPDLPMPKLDTSGGLATSAWQREGYVHVLAVEETGQKLDDFINPNRLALA